METMNTAGNLLIPLTLFLLAIVFMGFLTIMSPHLHRYKMNKRIKAEEASGVYSHERTPEAALKLRYQHPETLKVRTVRQHLSETMAITPRSERGFDRGARYCRDPGVALIALLVKEGFIDGHIDEAHKYVEWNTEDYDEFLIKMVSKV